MSEMVERVAQAIYRANPEHKRRPFHAADRWLQDQARDMARTAIAEMREPTSHVLDAGFHASDDFGYLSDNDDVAAVWQAMIDAALAAPAIIPHDRNTNQEKT